MITPIVSSGLALKQRVAKVTDLEKLIKQYQPDYQGNPFFTKYVSYVGNPTNSSSADNPTIVGKNDGTAWQIVKVTESYSQAVDKTAEFVEKLSQKLASKVEIAGVPLSSILSLMGFFPAAKEKNQFEPYFVALMNAMKEAQAATAQSDLHNLMEAIQKTIANAKSAAQGATEWVGLGKPSFDTYFAKYDGDSRNAVNEMMADARWLKVVDVTTYSQWETDAYKPWSVFLSIGKYGGNPWLFLNLNELASILPRESNGLIWTYQLALPALLYAINARLAVLQSFYPDFRTINQIYKNEIYDWISFLKNKVLAKLNHAIWVEEAKDWHTFSSYNKRSHYCCNIYTGEFVTGDADKDAKFIQQNGYYPVTPALDFFLGQRFLALYTPLVSGVLATIASLYQLASLTPYVWHDWQDLGGEVRGEVGAVNIAQTNLFELYVRGSDSYLWTKSLVLNGNVQEWKLLDNSLPIYSAPVAVSKDLGHRSLFATAQNGNVMHKLFQNAKWNAWENLGGIIKGRIGAVAPGGDVIDLYVRGTDDFLYEKYFANGKWTDWFLLDSSMKLASAPVAVSNDINHRAIYVHGADDTVYHKYWDGKQWHAWENLGRPPKQGTNRLPIVDVGAVTDKNGVTDLFVRGDDLKLWQKTYTNGWGNWVAIDNSGFQFQAAPVAVCARKLHRGIFVTGWDGKAYHKYWGE